jgi:hypothetical protein
MTPEATRTIDLVAVRSRYSAQVERHAAMNPPGFHCCSAHNSANDVPQLAAEVERLAHYAQTLEMMLAEAQQLRPAAEAAASVRPAVIDSAGDVADTATAAFMLLFTGHLDGTRNLLAELSPSDLMRVAQTASAFAIAADPSVPALPVDSTKES